MVVVVVVLFCRSRFVVIVMVRHLILWINIWILFRWSVHLRVPFYLRYLFSNNEKPLDRDSRCRSPIHTYIRFVVESLIFSATKNFYRFPCARDRSNGINNHSSFSGFIRVFFLLSFRFFFASHRECRLFDASIIR